MNIEDQYQYALLLSISNAKIFQKSFDLKNESRNKHDRIYDDKGKYGSKRTNDKWINQIHNKKFIFDNTFVENVLRVLCGQRPISRFRNIDYLVQRNDIMNVQRDIDKTIQEISNRTLNKITTFFNGTYEKSTVQKNVTNSWSKHFVPNWEYIRIFLNSIQDNLFDEFINLSCNTYSNKNDVIKNHTLFEYMTEMFGKNKNNQDVIKFLDKIKNEKENFKKFFNSAIDLTNEIEYYEYENFFYKKSGFHEGFGNKDGIALYLKAYEVNSCANVLYINGKLLIPIKNEIEKDLFKKGTGTATIFDGGFVEIEKLFDLSKINFRMLELDYERCV